MQYFETDLKTAEGITVIPSGSKVTPELILKLYFKDIYIDDSVKESSQLNVVNVLDTPSIVGSEVQVPQAEPVSVVDSDVVGIQLKEPKAPLPDISKKMQQDSVSQIQDVNFDFESDQSVVNSSMLGSDNSGVKEPPQPQIDLEVSAPKSSLPSMDSPSLSLGPQQVMPDIEGSSSIGGPSPTLPNMDSVLSNSGPKQALPDIEEKSETGGPRPVPKFMDLDDDVSAPVKASVIVDKPSFEEKVPEPVEVNPVLKFDEQQAQRMAKLAVELGVLLKYAGKDLDDLRDAALYCNRGVISFRQDDVKKRDFEIHKALESAQMAAIEGKLSERAIESIRLHPNDYESASFSLKQKIPHYHIIAIVYYYEKILKKEGSKMLVLDRMLQLGGNKFNIFVLHKFINMMKDINE